MRFFGAQAAEPFEGICESNDLSNYKNKNNRRYLRNETDSEVNRYEY